MRPEVTPAVLSAVMHIAARKRPAPANVDLEQTLVRDLGFDSLDIAELVAILEVELACDPFASDVAVADARTVGDLCAIYRRHLASLESPR